MCLNLSYFSTLLGKAKVGSICSKLYYSPYSKLKAATPKKVWNTSTQFPGLSEIPPSS